MWQAWYKAMLIVMSRYKLFKFDQILDLLYRVYLILIASRHVYGLSGLHIL